MDRCSHESNLTHSGSNRPLLKDTATIELMGVRINDLPVSVLIEYICDVVYRSDRAIIANVNVHAMNLAYDLVEFRTFLNNADIVFCDGFGVKLGAKLAGKLIRYRYTPPDWMADLCEMCVENGYSIFLLGARPGVAEQAKQRLLHDFPNIKLAGVHHGYFDKTKTSAENQAVIQTINQAKPDVLLVGFGMPLQELWLDANWQELNVSVALPVGALLDYVAGSVYRAPKWMTDNGLEWLGRLLIEPRRLWRRYIVGNPVFLWRVLKQRFGVLRLKE